LVRNRISVPHRNPAKTAKEHNMIGQIKSLREFFEIELHYAYDCEQKLVNKGLPAMIESASSRELRSALEHHLGETRGHVAGLERVFSILGVKADTKDNDIIDEMMKAAKDSAAHIEDSPLRDTALIVNGNQVEHYEIALYGSPISFARQLELREAVAPFERILAEEKAADAKLTQIAESARASERRAWRAWAACPFGIEQAI
jgi:ferritin-like metal-binding protein YciE